MRLLPLPALAIALLLGCRAGPPAKADGPRPRAGAPPASIDPMGPGGPGVEAAPAREGQAEPGARLLEGLDLEQALEMARRSHPALVAARARVAGAEARAAQSGRWENPDALLRVESASLEGSTFGSAELLAGISQPLPLGGRLAAAERAARADLLRAELKLEAVDLEVQARVRAAFAATLHAQHAAELLGELLEQARQLVAIFEARRERGDVAPEEGLSVELASLGAQRELERAEALLATAREELARALARPDLDLGPLTGELEPGLILPPIEEVLAALGRSPVLLSARAAVEADQARVALASAERVPDLRLDLLYRRLEASDQDAFDAGLTLPLPLFQRAGPRLDEARSRLAESRAREQAAELRLEAGARAAHARLARARADLARIDRDVLPRVERILAIQERRFAAGDLALPELLDSRSRASRARLARLEALQAALEAHAELSALLAEPGPGRDPARGG